MERNEKKVNKKMKTSIKMVNQVDGTVAEVDPRLGDFKDQFMLPVGSVIPKYFPDTWIVTLSGHLPNLQEGEAGEGEKARPSQPDGGGTCQDQGWQGQADGKDETASALQIVFHS